MRTYVSRIPELKFDVEHLANEFEKIIAQDPWQTQRHWNLTYRPGNDNITFSDSGTYYEPANDGVVYSENHATELNPLVKGTVFEQVLDQVRQFFPITRAKFTRIPAGFVYPVHQDLYNHIHIPLVGNNCGAMFDCHNTNQVTWMPPDGSTYYCNTKGVPHTFFNANHARSEQWRVNLLMACKLHNQEVENEPSII